MSKRRYLQVTLEFYRRVSGQRVTELSEIPAERMAFLSGMEYNDMVRPILIDALRDGTPLKSLASYYGVDHKTVMRWRDRMGLGS